MHLKEIKLFDCGVPRDDYLYIYPAWVCWPWIWKLIPFIKFGNLCAIISSDTLSLPFSPCLLETHLYLCQTYWHCPTVPTTVLISFFLCVLQLDHFSGSLVNLMTLPLFSSMLVTFSSFSNSLEWLRTQHFIYYYWFIIKDTHLHALFGYTTHWAPLICSIQKPSESYCQGGFWRFHFLGKGWWNHWPLVIGLNL